jgi:hypothetical protein
MSYFFWLGRDADEPLCDGDHENMECVEADGWITCHFSGPIK